MGVAQKLIWPQISNQAKTDYACYKSKVQKSKFQGTWCSQNTRKWQPKVVYTHKQSQNG